MRGDQDEWYAQPDPAAPNRGAQRQFSQGEREYQRLERDAADLMIIIQFGNALWGCCNVHNL